MSAKNIMKYMGWFDKIFQKREINNYVHIHILNGYLVSISL